MDEPLVHRQQRGRIDAETLGHAGAEAFDRHVRARGEVMRDSPAFVGLQVERDAALVPVDAEKDRAEARAP